MAVLVQEIVRADYAFVIHTTNPSNEDSSEIYAEVESIYFMQNAYKTFCYVLIKLYALCDSDCERFR